MRARIRLAVISLGLAAVPFLATAARRAPSGSKPLTRRTVTAGCGPTRPR